jgi:demethylmenaquinone methyltransferase / 2-methoxy-6-polyprenyl-1,4-benzoquinol methylase
MSEVQGSPQGPRQQDIQNLFTSVAHGYDQANDYMTLGMIHYWRRKLVRWSGVSEGHSVLDCATGTGDMAFEFKRFVGDRGTVIGTDFCEAMLKLAPEKSKKLELPVEFKTADVMNLPFVDGSFDACSIGYGIRNVEDPVKALSEMARVVKPGGCVMILETGQTQIPVLSTGMEMYFRYVVPFLGGWVTGRRDAYEYLNKSSMKFPSGEDFLKLMRQTGRFQRVECRSLMAGASYLYKGIV